VIPAFPKPGTLDVIVTNYELVRREERLKHLGAAVMARGGKVLLILDEAWMIASYKAAQTKAAAKLRWLCDRVVILNGTPGDPAAVYSQMAVLNPKILNFKNFFSFRARHAVMGGFMSKAITGWDNMDEFKAKVRPYALRRLKKDCLDLPKVSYTQIEAPLSPTTWAHYKAMRDELVTWLSQTEVVTAPQAGVKVMRLRQITSGFVGGIEDLDPQLYTDGIMPIPIGGTREIGREKLDALLDWLSKHWAASGDGLGKLLVWTHFKADVERAAKALTAAYPACKVVRFFGDSEPAEREEAKRLLAPGGDPAPAIVVGNAASGGAGLNFAAANLVIYLAGDFSLRSRLQSEGRVDRPGQTRPVLYVDVLATGTNGERTLDHQVVSALRKKQDLSDMTASAWREMLTAA
jgi:SNF2 family DNA or RNA helicase